MTIHNGEKPPVDLDLGCSVILPWQSVATVAAQELPELSKLNPQEVFSVVNCHPVCILFCPTEDGRCGSRLFFLCDIGAIIIIIISGRGRQRQPKVAAGPQMQPTTAQLSSQPSQPSSVTVRGFIVKCVVSAELWGRQ